MMVCERIEGILSSPPGEGGDDRAHITPPGALTRGGDVYNTCTRALQYLYAAYNICMRPSIAK